MDIAPQLDIHFMEPPVNDLDYPTVDGGSAVTHYRIEWDPDVNFNSAPGGGALGHYDAPVAAPCTAFCEQTIGMEVQQFVLAAATGRFTDGEFTLSFGGDTTACLDWEISGADLAGALNGLASIGAGGVSATREGDGTADSIYGYTWRVTFTSEALSLDVDQITVSTGTAAGCTDFMGGSGWALTPSTVVEGGNLAPGVPHYVRVSAINAVGRGPALGATVINEAGVTPAVLALAPRAPPTMPLNIISESIVDSSTTLRLFWEAPTSNEGGTIIDYLLEWGTDAGVPIASETVAVGPGTAQPADGPFVHVFPTDPADALVPGTTYWISVRARNDQTPLGDVAYATPRCQSPLENCSPETRPRALPDAPAIVLSAQGNIMEFTDTTLSVSFETALTGQGGFDASALTVAGQTAPTTTSMFVDKYKVEWDVEPSFNTVDGKALSFDASATELLSECMPDCVGTSPEVAALATQLVWTTSDTAVDGGDMLIKYGPDEAVACVAYNADEATMKAYIEGISADINDVTVVRSGAEAGGLVWTVTFNDPAAPTYPLIASDLTNADSSLTCGVTCSGGGTVCEADQQVVTPTYTINGLTQGQIYHVRVSGHNTLGYGALSLVHTSKPHDEPTVARHIALSRYSDDDSDVGTSLRVTWQTPDDPGGDLMSHYRVEWATEDWDNVALTEHTIKTAAASQISGTFTVLVDSSACVDCPIQDIYTTGELPFDISAEALTDALQNLPNVDTLTIVRSDVDPAVGSFAWHITYESQIYTVAAPAGGRRGPVGRRRAHWHVCGRVHHGGGRGRHVACSGLPRGGQRAARGASDVHVE